MRFKRESTPLLTQEIRFFPLIHQAGSDVFRFGSGEDVNLKLPKASQHHTMISRRQFNVFVNQHNSWMLEDISKNSTLVNHEKIHRSQIALYPEVSTFISLESLEFLIHVCASINNQLVCYSNISLRILDFEALEL